MPSLRSIDDPHALLQALMRADFGAFLRKAYPAIRGGEALLWNWHLDAIAHQLDEVRHRRCRRLLVTMPPRNLKSIAITVAWVAWMLGQDPRQNFVCVSYSNDLSSKLARLCLAIMQTEWYRELFPGTLISTKRSAADDFETTRGGGRLATSITGTLTGRGGDIIIIDDPIKPTEAHSETCREAVNQWYKSTLASRLNDKASGAIVTVMQRLHQYDLAGMQIETGVWQQLSLPAIATRDERIPLTRGRIHHRKVDDVLHPAREPRPVLDAQRADMGSIDFSAQFQQDPVPATGNFVQPEHLKRYVDPPAVGVTVLSLDTASKPGVATDFTAGIVARYYGGRFYVLEVLRERLAFGKMQAAVIDLCRRYDVQRLLIEDAASGTQLLDILRRYPFPGVPLPIACKPEGDKTTRFAAQASKIEAGAVVLPEAAPWEADFISEIIGFPNRRYDDQADALAQMLANPPPQMTTFLVGPEPIDFDRPYSNDPDLGSEDDPWSGL